MAEEDDEARPVERRQGVSEFLEALAESTKSIEASVEARIRAHADESREALKELHESLRGNAAKAAEIGEKTDQIGEVLKPIPEQIARLDERMAGIEDDNDKQWEHITKAKDSQRDLEVQLAEERGRQQARAESQPASRSSASFWQSQNGKILLATIFVATCGLLTLAGYNVATSFEVLPK